MTYYLFFVFILFAIHRNFQITNQQNYIFLSIFAFFISLVVGLSVNEDEYYRLYILYPTISDFLKLSCY